MTDELTAAAQRAAGIGLRSERGPVLAALMLSMALVALDSTIIATAVPSIVHELGGVAQFPWLFSSYLLTQAVTVPLYGKFADVFGRKPVLLLGVVVFVVGSVLCGLSWSLPALIAFRGLQGVGAGAVQPMTLTIVGDLYSVAERARVQGYVASVWGIASVIGPAVGGIFSQYLTWRWIFFVNLPVGIAAAWVLIRHFREQVTRRSHTVDVAGAASLMAGCSLIILGLLEGGVAWAWGSAASVAIFAAGSGLLLLFGLAERRAVEPVLPLWAFGRRTLAAGNLVAVAVGALMMGLSSYVPTFVQGVLGAGPLMAGFVLAALTIGWPLAASLSGRVYLRIGFRDTALIGAAVIVAGTLLLGRSTPTAALWSVAGACFVVGAGLGLSSSPTVVAVQSVVGWDRRGVVTGMNMFSRSMGSAVGVAAFGAIANAALAHRLADAPAAVAARLPPGVDAARLVLGGSRRAVDPQVAGLLRSAVYEATHQVFVVLVAVAVFAAVALLFMPRRTVPLTFGSEQ